MISPIKRRLHGFIKNEDDYNDWYAITLIKKAIIPINKKCIPVKGIRVIMLESVKSQQQIL